MNKKTPNNPQKKKLDNEFPKCFQEVISVAK